MKLAGAVTAPPTRLRARAVPGSALEQGLSLAHTRGPTDDQLRALERNVLAALGAAGAASIVTAAARAAGATSGARPAAGFSIGVAKIVIALALAAGAGTGVWIWRQQAPATSPPAAMSVPRLTTTTPEPVRPLPATVAGPVLAIPRGPMVARTKRAVTATAADRAPAAPAAESARAAPIANAPVDDTEELRLLARAQKALALDPAFALTLAHEHQRRFPNGSMDQEREVIAVSALVSLGRADEARQRAERFARNHAGSAYATRMQSIVARAAAQP